MSQQRPEWSHLASTSRLPSSPHQEGTLADSHRDLNRLTGGNSVVFPVEIWLSILESLSLRDLYSLTVAVKFFYNNFTSIYRNRVAQEGIPVPQPNRPKEIAALATTHLFVMIYATSIFEATVAGMAIVKSPDVSRQTYIGLILVACGYTFILAILCHANARYTVFGFPTASRWGVWLWIRVISIMLVHIALVISDCTSIFRSPIGICWWWLPILVAVWLQWALVMIVLCCKYYGNRGVNAASTKSLP